MVGALLATSLLLSREDPSITCTIATEDRGTLAITFKNTSLTDVDAEIFPAMILELSDPQANAPGPRDNYWAPLDVKSARPRGPNQASRLRLRPGETIRNVVPLSRLLWDRSISSAWPDRTIDEIAPFGRYTLYLEVEGPVRAQKVH